MIHNVDWNMVQEIGDLPAPGGYAAVILGVEDKEERQYLEIRWDFLNGPFKGSNQRTYDRANFWPTLLRRSYKPTALGFFKAFKTAVEESNRGYVFDDYHIDGLIGKRMGVVLGEEEYQKKDGSIGRRLYVHQVRSFRAIEDGDFIVPPLKKLTRAMPGNEDWKGGGWSIGLKEEPNIDGDIPF